MRRAAALGLAVAAFAAIAATLALRSSPASDARTDPPAARAPRTIRAEGIVVERSAVRETARTVGSLAANESIDVVPEISRRLVSVHADEGATVERGDLLFTLDGADLRASLAELAARRELAARTLERHRALAEGKRKALSEQAHDQARTDLRAIDAQIEAVQVTLAKTEIRAPFAGRIGIRRVSQGAWVTPATQLTTLHDTSRIKIDFTLPERYAAAVEPGREFEFRVAGREQPFRGRVSVIEPRIDAETRSLLVRGETPNPDGKLVPGAFATIEMPLAAVSDGVAVPSHALVPSATGHDVYVLQNGTAELRPVEIGVRTADAVQILSGLEPGETVLTTNLLRLEPGSPVELVEAARPAQSAGVPASGPS